MEIPPTSPPGGETSSTASQRIIPGLESTPSSSRTESTRHASRLVNFADLLNVVVVGNPTEQQLGQLEAHFRTIHSTPNPGEILRQLRQLTELHTRYPIMIFDQTSNGRLVTLEAHRTACAGEQVELPAPVDAAEVSRQREETDMGRMTAFIRAVSYFLERSQEGRFVSQRALALAQNRDYWRVGPLAQMQMRLDVRSEEESENSVAELFLLHLGVNTPIRSRVSQLGIPFDRDRSFRHRDR